MSIVFQQKFEYAAIRIFKNYSNIASKKKAMVRSEPEKEIDPFDTNEVTLRWKEVEVATDNHKKISQFRLFGKDNKKHFFYDPSVSKDNFSYVELVKCKVPNKNKKDNEFTFYTTKDQHIRKHYNNPFSSIVLYQVQRWIKEENGKVTIKYYVRSRTRVANHKYFTKKVLSTSFIFDKKTGNFMTVNYQSTGKKVQKRFKKNSFNAAKSALESIISTGNIMNPTNPVYNDFMNAMYFHNFINPVLKTLDITDSFNPWHDMGNHIIKKIKEKFIKIRKIKVPNEYDRLLTSFYPTEKYLKKNDRKLVSSVLDRLDMKSSITNKLVHQIPDISLKDLWHLRYILGNDYTKYMGNISPEVFKCYKSRTEDRDLYHDRSVKTIRILQPEEKESVVHIVNGIVRYNEAIEKKDWEKINPRYRLRYYDIGNLITDIYDHVAMMERLQFVYPDIRLTARSVNAFRNDHLELSKLTEEVKRGYVIEYDFDLTLVERIEKVINHGEHIVNTSDGLTWDETSFHPVLLKSSKEYSEEGFYMHHCVGGYADGINRSIIVSLRNGEERVTCEFSTESGKCYQSRYFFNVSPPDHFKKPLEILKARMINIAMSKPKGLLPLETRTIPLVINGVEIHPQELQCNLLPF